VSITRNAKVLSRVCRGMLGTFIVSEVVYSRSKVVSV